MLFCQHPEKIRLEREGGWTKTGESSQGAHIIIPAEKKPQQIPPSLHIFNEQLLYLNLENVTTILEIVTRVCVADAIESIHYGNFSIYLRKVLVGLHSLLHFMKTIFTSVKVW